MTEADTELTAKAIEIGFNPQEFPCFLWIAVEFSQADPPEPWTAYSDEHGQVFYYDHNSGESAWTHPLLETFRSLYKKCAEEPGLLEYYQELYHNLRSYCDDKKGWWALNLLATPGGGAPPTPEEVRDMALYLQINLKNEPELMWIAKQAVQVPLPGHWEEHEDSTGNVYFYDKTSGVSQLKHPLDDYFFALVHEERKKLSTKRLGRTAAASVKVAWMPFLDDEGDTFFVSFAHNVSTYYPPWDKRFQDGSRRIQRWWRRYLAAKKRVNDAATIIQKYHRGHVVRDAVAAWKQECAALCIQTMYRMYRARTEALQERSALVVQSYWRMGLARAEYRRLLKIIRIQSCYRGFVARKQFKRQKAAQNIQRHYRGFRDRERVAQLRVKWDAATKIQAVQRGRLARRYVDDYRLHQAAIKIQSQVRRRKAKRAVAEERYFQKADSAALYIQTCARRMLARRILAEKREGRDKTLAATAIQAAYRGFEARQYAQWLRHSNAALIIQKYWGRYHGVRSKELSQAQIVISKYYRGRKARQWKAFIMKSELDLLHSSATTIQRYWRGYYSRDSSEKSNAAITIQKLVKGMIAVNNYKKSKAAIKIQSVFKGRAQRKKGTEDLWRFRFVAFRMQAVYRIRIARRQAVVERMMYEYRQAMAKRIQDHWRGKQMRAVLKERMLLRGEHTGAGLVIQTIWRGRQARKQATFERRAIALVISAWKRVKAKRALNFLKDLFAKRRSALTALRPLYEALFQLPSAGQGPRRERLVEQYILKDNLPEGDELLTQKAVDILEKQVVTLGDECSKRAQTRDYGLQIMMLSYSLLRIPEPQWLKLPPQGTPAWLGDEAMAKLAAEEKRLQQLKSEDAKNLAEQVRVRLRALIEELNVTNDYKKSCKSILESSNVSVEMLDTLIARASELQSIRNIVVPMVDLIKRRKELAAMRKELPDEKETLMDRKAGAALRQRQQATKTMLDLEQPRVNKELYNMIYEIDTNKQSLPVPYERICQIGGLPDIIKLKAEMDRDAKARQELLKDKKMSKSPGMSLKAAVGSVKAMQALTKGGKSSASSSVSSPKDSSKKSGGPGSPGGNEEQGNGDTPGDAQEAAASRPRRKKRDKVRKGIVGGLEEQG
ncbi:hypothetical protein CYMTET_44706 [Cymbomonas tetramitiformis]|uniref:WW domain-containing protein n=1 Tax=Cymbomonas tetramitiformis TaxID=36881 RepID=A0AAE0BZP1_9CHLO|nr:hypothetical protein CYMTET_44706 [Cymbomonas tetramitiformis]